MGASVLVGRSAELDAIRSVLTRARDGRGGALVLHGDAGIGKTALLRAAHEFVDGMLVLDLSGIEAESELPFAGLSLLLAPLRRDLASTPNDLDALAAAVGLRSSRPATRFAVYAGLLTLLTQEAEERPIAVFVDDAQWIDTASAEALGFCARRLDHEPVVVVAAVRAGESDPLAAARLPTLDVQPLSAEASAELVIGAMREPARAAPAIMGQVHRVAHGNPLALIELARRLDAGDLATIDLWSETPSVGRELERALARRVETLPPTTRDALLVAATNDGDVVDELTAAMGLGAGSDAFLAPAEIAGVIELADGRLAFSHPLLRSAIYHLASAPARRSAHASLAAVLAERGHEARSAWHLALATVEPDESVARRMEAVARTSRDRDAPLAAARAFEASARVTPDDRLRATRLLAAGESLHLAGRFDAALAVLDEALPLADEPLLLADVQRERALAAATLHPPSMTRDVLLQQASSIEYDHPARAARMMLEASALSVSLADVPGARELAERAFALVSIGHPDTRLLAAGYLAMYRIVGGDSESGEYLLHKAEALRGTSEMASFTYASVLVGHSFMYIDEDEKAREILDACIARARAESALMVLPLALAWAAETEFRLGDWPRTQAQAAESIALGDELGRPFESLNGLITLAALRGAQERTTEALELLDRADLIINASGFRALSPHANGARGLVHLSVGRLEEASDALVSAGEAMQEAGVHEPNVVSWAGDLAEAFIRQGRNAEAAAILALLEAQATRTGRRSGHATAARCRGLMAGDDDFDAHFREALGWHGQTRQPFSLARTQLCFGERLRRARRRREAREPLRRALETFERLNARAWVQRTEAELGATGEHVRPRSPDHIDDLTPQEMQVALLVASGASNRDAAARLFITPKTVEAHLTRVYRKLGVRSRVEMVHRLAGYDAAAG